MNSRHNGRELLRERLENMRKPEGPPLFMFNHCRQFIRAVAVLPRDEIDMDDVDNTAEEHVETPHGPTRSPVAGGGHIVHKRLDIGSGNGIIMWGLL